MDALMAALVVGVLASIGDKPAWLAAILADRWRRPGLVILAALPALLLAAALAALAGALIGSRLTPEARLLMLALALLLQGGGAIGRVKAPDGLAGWRIGAVATTLLGLFILAFGGGIQFVVATLAARTPLPWLAAIGGAAGSLATVAVAAVLGEAAWLALPLRPVRLVVAALFLLAGAILALQALALV